MNLSIIGLILIISGFIVATFVSVQIGLTLLIIGIVADIIALYGKFMDFVEKHGFFKTLALGLIIGIPLMFLWIHLTERI